MKKSLKYSHSDKRHPFDVASLLQSWIPPFGILFGLLSYASSWVIMFFAGVETSPVTGIPFRFQLAWIHTLTIGLFTMIAISILFHVLPAFTREPVAHEMAARKTLPVLGLGVIGIVGFFISQGRPQWAWGFSVGALAVLLWAAFFLTSIVNGFAKKTSSRIQFAFFSIPSIFLAATAVFGLWIGTDLVFPPFPDWIFTRILPVHISMGLLGWLTLLIWLVSGLTHKPMLGISTDYPLGVPVSSGSLAVGLLCFVVGRLSDFPLFIRIGEAIIFLSSLLYLAWSVLLLQKTHPMHPILKVWWITSVSGLSFSLATWAGFLLFGTRLDLVVYIFIAIWLEPILLGHLHLIGVRLLATLVLGPEGQTPPKLVLKTSYSWAFWGTFLLASLLGFFGLYLSNSELLVFSGVVGFASAGLLLAHILYMIQEFKRLSRTSPPPSTFIRFPL
jgi:hypothetical protein